jgi:hypothetical protein
MYHNKLKMYLVEKNKLDNQSVLMCHTLVS